MKIIFFDRDGTIIKEPITDYQVDSLDKLEFIPKVIRNLYKIRQETDFIFVMISNQDGRGTSSFPEENFIIPHNKMLAILEGEGITFDDILIDNSLPSENSPNRKPKTGMLTKYLENKNYDIANSFVVGDRITDVELAKNLNCKAIFFAEKDRISDLKNLEENCALTSSDWDEIYNFFTKNRRIAEIKRQTNETDICVNINLDGSGIYQIDTGLGFFNHLLEQLAKHSGVDMIIKVKGDLHIDEHHTIEDTAIAIGEAFLQALGSKKSIERYGFVLPMDEAEATVSLDFSGRPYLVWNAKFKREKLGDMPTEMFYHFFKSFSDSAKCNINIKVEGENEHHKIESVFKAVAKSIKQAVKQSKDNANIPSTKGIL